jgi:hypothetical protein
MCDPNKIINTLLGGYFKEAIPAYSTYVNFFFHFEKTNFFTFFLFLSSFFQLINSYEITRDSQTLIFF